MKLNIDDTFSRLLPADPIKGVQRRQVYNACFSWITPRCPSNPSLIHASPDVAELLGLQEEDLSSEQFLRVFSGAEVLSNTMPYATCYGGHQFGNWADQLGDGRAINLAEVLHQQQRWALQLKGAGETPYSRHADGLAVLRSSLREHLCSEAMHYLRVPTTRSLCLILTGDAVMRDIMYDGHPKYEKGAVICRVAPNFIRFGHFQIFAARQDIAILKQLTDYTMTHFFPSIAASGLQGKAAYLRFLQLVMEQTLAMIIHWQRVGFVHGVMNTDNMSILGLTIDYGPYGWLEAYQHGWTPNTTDRAHKRYRYGAQPQIALWNLVQLANALYPLVEDVEPLEAILNDYPSAYSEQYLIMMRQKLGLQIPFAEDQALVDALEQVLHVIETDMTIWFRLLAKVNANMSVNRALAILSPAFYQANLLKDAVLMQWKTWLIQYQRRLQMETGQVAEREALMNQVNPKYVLRNYMAQLAIDAAEKGDYDLVNNFHIMLQQPYAEAPQYEAWFAKRPDWARNKVGCSMLSCSS